MKSVKSGLWSIFFLGVFWPGGAFCQGAGVKFVKGVSWEEALKMAKVTKKFIFVDCYASWCGPCKSMDEKVYPDEQVGRYYNDNFICLRLQLDTAKKDDEEVRLHYADAHQIKENYQVDRYPTFLFMSPDGEVVHRGVGFLGVDELVKLGQDALNGNEQFYTLMRRFKKGELDSFGDVKRLAILAARLYFDSLAKQAAKAYIGRLTIGELGVKDNIDFIYRFTTSSTDRGFSLFRDSSQWVSIIEPRITKERSLALVEKIIYKEEVAPYKLSKHGLPDWGKISRNIRKYGKLGEEACQSYSSKMVFEAYIEPALLRRRPWSKVLSLIKGEAKRTGELKLVALTLDFYEKAMDQGDVESSKGFFEGARYWASQYSNTMTPLQYNQLAWSEFLHDTVVADLQVALNWARMAVGSADKDDAWRVDYMDTYSNLLYKLGRRAEAIVLEKQVVALRPKDSEKVLTLQKMEHGNATW